MACDKGRNSREAEASSSNAATEGSGSEIQRQRSLNGRTTGPTRRSTKGQWTPKEDAMLYQAVQRFKGKNWKKIAECFPDRTDVQCLHRWQKVLNPELVKGPWSKEEDDIIIQMVNKYGPKKWSTIARALPGRIGKQCRERWHNHLNPSINKEAWTQEEEIILIHAHQIYGNKWAELTKYLPGRTDNAIKNHWNSSVKKKLNSYHASGLLAEFKGLPQIEHPTNYLPSSTVNKKYSEEDRHEIEDLSECSQSSSRHVSCSQSDSNLVNSFSIYKDLKLKEGAEQQVLQESHFSEHTNKYYSSIEEIDCVVPEMQSGDFDSPNLLPKVKLSESIADQVGAHELSSTSPPEDSENSMKLMESSDYPTVSTKYDGESSDYPTVSTKYDGLRNISLSESLELEDSTFLSEGDPGSEKQDKLLEPDADGFNDKSFEAEIHQGTSFEDLITSSSFADLYYLSSVNNQHAYGSQPYKSLVSCSKPLYTIGSSSPLAVSHSQCIMTVATPCNRCSSNVRSISDNVGTREVPVGTQGSEVITCSYDGFAYSSRSALCHNDVAGPNVFLPEDHGQEIRTPRKNYVEGMVSSSSNANHKDGLSDEHLCVQTKDQQDPGALFYEPPRFPSLEVPFVSCDLISSGDLQEFSPLGIRQLMMSSMNCSTPCSLWDSPSQGESPDAVLKSAAKSFICTPSIMKKRRRVLLSPMQERRNDKKPGLDIGCHPFGLSSGNMIEKSCMINANQTIDGAASGFAEGRTLSPSGNQEKKVDCLTENKENACPNSAFVVDANNGLASNVLTEGCKASCSLAKKESSVATINAATEVKASVLVRTECTPSAYPSKTMKEKCGSSIDMELGKLNIFADTPSIKRGIESPSAWKSPWFMNSLLPGIMDEDVGYFMSPGCGTYDAITLMKQLSEHTAAAAAEAQEVLRSGSLVVGSEQRQTDKLIKGNLQSDKEVKNHHIQPKAMAEARVLDFSECATPVRKTESAEARITGTPVSYLSPSAYLLKGCR